MSLKPNASMAFLAPFTRADSPTKRTVQNVSARHLFVCADIDRLSSSLICHRLRHRSYYEHRELLAEYHRNLTISRDFGNEWRPMVFEEPKH
jgi:hypothetical protein